MQLRSTDGKSTCCWAPRPDRSSPSPPSAGKNSGTRGWDVTNAYTLGGGVQGNQQFTLDGANITLQNNGKQGTWTIAPNADALQEANVMTSTFDSRYGRTGGGTVNMVVKSGSNGIH